METEYQFVWDCKAHDVGAASLRFADKSLGRVFTHSINYSTKEAVEVEGIEHEKFSIQFVTTSKDVSLRVSEMSNGELHQWIGNLFQLKSKIKHYWNSDIIVYKEADTEDVKHKNGYLVCFYKQLDETHLYTIVLSPTH